MRSLTIKREKRFVACLATLKIYIEDPYSSDLVINGVSCRNLGVLKNGEEKTFYIGDSEAKVYVIDGKVSKGFCNEFYQLPEGRDDITLTGKNVFNLATGNAFRFDNNDCEAVLKNRRKSSRIGAWVLLVAVILGSVGAYFLDDALLSKKKFTADEFSIVLTTDFTRITYQDFDITAVSDDVDMFVYKDVYTPEEAANITLKQYAAWLRTEFLYDSEVMVDGNFMYFIDNVANPKTNEVFHQYCVVYKNGNNFWVVQFATPIDKAEKYDKKFLNWARTVKFSD